jgi:hypothetical protein
MKCIALGINMQTEDIIVAGYIKGLNSSYDTCKRITFGKSIAVATLQEGTEISRAWTPTVGVE